MEWDTNDLRALAGIILLLLALVVLYTNNENESINLIIIAMAGFLVGGQMLGRSDK